MRISERSSIGRSRSNRHDLMIEMEMDPEALPVYDASAAHQEWKAKYGDAIQSKTIFDYE